MLSFNPEDRISATDVCQKLIEAKKFNLECIELFNIKHFLSELINIVKNPLPQKK